MRTHNNGKGYSGGGSYSAGIRIASSLDPSAMLGMTAKEKDQECVDRQV
ncbi:hypothetical protein [Rufibacter roseus]|uniref:Uncharacterized protein n=1 Tax=Rufibacter roseus TaxID=1567108 RepID=A0ABW2DNM5_9BACT|nr:hypothetical protein [Rufibacter roseus]